MNKVILIGRMTDKPKTNEAVTVAKYTLAVDRRFKKDGEPDADFINCLAFNKNAEFANKYLEKGTKIAVEGRIQTGSYTNKDGQKVYTTEVVVENHEFCEKKNTEVKASSDFMTIPEGISEELPFN